MPSIGEIGAVQHVVAAPQDARPLQRQDVERLLDDAQAVVVASGVEADGAPRPGADVEAPVAEHDLVPDRDQRRREGTGLAVRGAQQVVGQPLRGLGPDAGQSRERLDEAGDRFDERGHARPQKPGISQAARDARHPLLARAPCLAQRIAHGGEHQVLEHLDIVGIDHVRADRDRHDLLLAGRRPP